MKMLPTGLSAADLRKLFRYDPETGHFYRLTSAGGFHIGSKAGKKSRLGYVLIQIRGKVHCAHRLAWLYVEGREPVSEIDHINGSRDDNRIINLRECNRSQNQANCAIGRNNTSGFKGVSKCQWNGTKWKAKIKANGKQIFLGYFNTKEEAHAAYVAASKKHFGDFARAA